MFSSNPFPDLPSSPNNVFFPPYFLFDHGKDRTCFNYHLNNSDPFSSGDFFHDYNPLPPPSPAIPNPTTIKHDFFSKENKCFEELGFHDDDLLDAVISSCKKKLPESKKDGHSKIYTARGFRDRRVRLSIDISQKFFSLQDLLGFDKASKTLDWLFGKCKTAIQELVEETSHSPSSTTTYQSKTSFLEAIMGGVNGGKFKSKKKYVHDGKKKNNIMTQKQKGHGFQDYKLPRDQSRVVARARARERVIEKMRIRKLDDELKTLVHDDEFDNQKFKLSSGEENHHMIISSDPAAW